MRHPIFDLETIFCQNPAAKADICARPRLALSEGIDVIVPGGRSSETDTVALEKPVRERTEKAKVESPNRTKLRAADEVAGLIERCEAA
jgi:hypothetical protein